MKYSLKKSQIIKKPETFDQIFKQGKRIKSKHIILIALKSNQKQFGFAVSQKIKGAVKKNRARRRLREIVRLNQDKIPENLALVVVAKQGVERVKFNLLEKEFLHNLQKLGSNDST